MISRDNCFLCGLKSENLPSRGKAEVGVACMRCGDYYIDDLLLECKEPAINKFNYILSGYTRWEKELGNPLPELHAQNINKIIKDLNNVTVKEKIDRILTFYSSKSLGKGKYVNFDLNMDYPVAFANGTEEFSYLLSEETQNTFRFITVVARGVLNITPQGWRRIELLERVKLAEEKFILVNEDIDDSLKRDEWTSPSFVDIPKSLT